MFLFLKKCPICGKEVEVHGGVEEWKPTFYDPDSGGEPYYIHCDCGLEFSIGYCEYEEFQNAWNNRVDEISKHGIRVVLNNAKALKDEYEWLMELNDDSLSHQVQTRNDVQNALLELFRFLEDVNDLLSDQNNEIK